MNFYVFPTRSLLFSSTPSFFFPLILFVFLSCTERLMTLVELSVCTLSSLAQNGSVKISHYIFRPTAIVDRCPTVSLSRTFLPISVSTIFGVTFDFRARRDPLCTVIHTAVNPLDYSDNPGTRSEMLTLIDYSERFCLNFVQPASSPVRSDYVYFFLTSRGDVVLGGGWRILFYDGFIVPHRVFTYLAFVKTIKRRVHGKRVSYDNKRFPVEGGFFFFFVPLPCISRSLPYWRVFFVNSK